MQQHQIQVALPANLWFKLLQNLRSKSVGVSSFLVLFEDSNIHLLDFQIWCCELCVENWWSRGREHYFLKSEVFMSGQLKSHLFLPVHSFDSRLSQDMTWSRFLVATFLIWFHFISVSILVCVEQTETTCFPGAIWRLRNKRYNTKQEK